ncbi:ABC transporter permease [Telmatospirillum sp.]|uniref:ABC transporter permease n=1 Tax=Telmatospirillum sp. TaxID=2079197 RepID=UPI00284FD84F|nr:ABC transporter permease [Telmatospirillum sp.]MDR3439386.1 ABC transporter permease [Telmatospirillum sp.]
MTMKQVWTIVLNLFGPVATVIAVLAIWKCIEQGWHIPRYLLPTPSEVYAATVANVGALWRNTAATMEIIVFGFVVSVVVAVPLAFLIVTFHFFERLCYPLIIILQFIPKTIVAPLLLVWLGIGVLPKSALVMLMTFFPILLESISGFRLIDKRIFYITQSMGASRAEEFFFVRIPGAMPSIFAGMKTATVYAVTGAITAEFIGSNEGIGYMILQASGDLDMPLTLAAVIASALLGVILSAAMLASEKLLMPWMEHR